MFFSFEDSYLKALKENEIFNSNEVIGQQVKAQLQFKYGNVDQQHFKFTYEAEGWLGRKMMALPSAIWSGVIQASYRLALAILIGIPFACLGHTKYLKIQVFHLARDLQIAYGSLASLINDRYGQFHVQESRFHKSCYQYFTTTSSPGEEFMTLKPETPKMKTSPLKSKGTVTDLEEGLKQWSSVKDFQRLDPLLADENSKNLEDFRTLSDEEIFLLSQLLKGITNNKCLSGLDNLGDSSPSTVTESDFPALDDLTGLIEDKDDGVFSSSRENLSLEELKFQYDNEIECINNLNQTFCSGIEMTQKAKNRMTKVKEKHQDLAKRLLSLINAQGGCLDGPHEIKGRSPLKAKRNPHAVKFNSIVEIF